jgi:hypothetical protein
MTSVSLQNGGVFTGSMSDTPTGVVATLARAGASYVSYPAAPNPRPLTVAIFAVTNTSPIVVIAGSLNLLPPGTTIAITGVLGCTAANGTWTPIVSGSKMILPGSAGNGIYIGGGSFVIPAPLRPPQPTPPPFVTSTGPPTVVAPNAATARSYLGIAYDWSGDVSFSAAAFYLAGTMLSAYNAAKAAGK